MLGVYTYLQHGEWSKQATPVVSASMPHILLSLLLFSGIIAISTSRGLVRPIPDVGVVVFSHVLQDDPCWQTQLNGLHGEERQAGSWPFGDHTFDKLKWLPVKPKKAFMVHGLISPTNWTLRATASFQLVFCHGSGISGWDGPRRNRAWDLTQKSLIHWAVPIGGGFELLGYLSPPTVVCFEGFLDVHGYLGWPNNWPQNNQVGPSPTSTGRLM